MPDSHRQNETELAKHEGEEENQPGVEIVKKPEEIPSRILPGFVFPPRPPQYRLFWTTEDQLELIQAQTSETAENLAFASSALGILATVVTTLLATKPDLPGTHPHVFDFLLFAGIVMGVVVLVKGAAWVRTRKKVPAIIEKIRSQHG